MNHSQSTETETGEFVPAVSRFVATALVASGIQPEESRTNKAGTRVLIITRQALHAEALLALITKIDGSDQYDFRRVGPRKITVSTRPTVRVRTVKPEPVAVDVDPTVLRDLFIRTSLGFYADTSDAAVNDLQSHERVTLCVTLDLTYCDVIKRYSAVPYARAGVGTSQSDAAEMAAAAEPVSLTRKSTNGTGTAACLMALYPALRGSEPTVRERSIAGGVLRDAEVGKRPWSQVPPHLQDVIVRGAAHYARTHANNRLGKKTVESILNDARDLHVTVLEAMEAEGLTLWDTKGMRERSRAAKAAKAETN